MNTLHNPSTGTSPPATWGDQVRDNFEYHNLRGPYICTSATRPGSPFEGQLIYETDTNKYLSYDGAAWWTVGRAITTATSHTPTLAQGASTNISKTLTVSEYAIVNGVCEWWFLITATAAGTAGSGITLTLPVNSAQATLLTPVGGGFVNDISGSTYDTGAWCIFDNDQILFVAGESTTAAWGQTPNIALANGDVMGGNVRFRIASAA